MTHEWRQWRAALQHLKVVAKVGSGPSQPTILTHLGESAVALPQVRFEPKLSGSTLRLKGAEERIAAIDDRTVRSSLTSVGIFAALQN